MDLRTDRESERGLVDPELEGVISSGFNVTARQCLKKVKGGTYVHW